MTLNLSPLSKLCLLAGLLLVLSAGAGFAGDWAGTYKTEDTKGNAMSVVLKADGTASGEKHGTVMTGTWTNEDGAAVIKWETGWMTAFRKDGDGYTKSAYRPGMSLQDTPTNTVAAEKVE